MSRSGRGRREPRSDRPTLGERIRRERQRLGLTQAELAGEEMTKSFISQVEADLARPSLRTLQLLAQRLNRPVSYFLDEPEVDPPAPPLAAFPALRQARALAAAGATAQALERLDQALVELPPTDLLSQARLLSLRAELMASTGPPDQVVHAYRQAADAWRATGDEREEASLLLHWARYEMTRGRTDRAIRLLERGLDRLGDSPEDEWLQANLRAELGLALARRGAPAEAIEHLKEALWAMDDLTDFARYGEVALTLGRLLGQTGEHEAAQVMVERSLYFFQALGDRERTIDGYLHLTWVKARAGQGDGARWAVKLGRPNGPGAAPGPSPADRGPAGPGVVGRLGRPGLRCPSPLGGRHPGGRAPRPALGPPGAGPASLAGGAAGGGPDPAPEGAGPAGRVRRCRRPVRARPGGAGPRL